MQAVLDIVLPVFGLVFVGYLVGRTPLLTEAGIKGLTNFVFFVAMPVFLFRTMSELEIPDTVDPLLPVAYYAAALPLYATVYLVGRFAFGLKAEPGAMFAMGATFSNSVLLGIPLAFLTFGDEGLLAILFIVAFHPLIMMTVPSVIISVARGGDQTWRKSIASALLSILKNPVIFSMLAGLVWGAAGFGLPQPVERFADLLKAAAPTTALFAVGASLAGFRIAGDPAQSAAMVVLKLAAMPAIVWLVSSFVFHLSPFNTAIATLMAAMPTGVNVFLLASAYDVYRERAATAVVVSTALAIFSTGLLIALLAPSK